MIERLDLCRWLYNYFLGMIKSCRKQPAKSLLKQMIPVLCRHKKDLAKVHSKTRQAVLDQLYHNLSVLSLLKTSGKKVDAVVSG